MSEPQFTMEIGKQRHYTRVFGRWYWRDWVYATVVVLAPFVLVVSGTVTVVVWAHG